MAEELRGVAPVEGRELEGLPVGLGRADEKEEGEEAQVLQAAQNKGGVSIMITKTRRQRSREIYIELIDLCVAQP